MRLSLVILLITFALATQARSTLQSINQSVDQSGNRLDNQHLNNQTVARTIIVDGHIYQLLSQSIDHSIDSLSNDSIKQTNIPSIDQSINQPNQRSRRRPFLIAIAQTIKQSVTSLLPDQSVNHSIDQTNNQLSDQTNLESNKQTNDQIRDQLIKQSNNQSISDSPDLISPSSAEFYIYLGGSLCLLLGGGLMSGLTIGLFSLSNLELAVLQNDKDSDANDRRHARRLGPLLREDRHHLLLVTLLLANTGCMEALPELLDKLVPEWAAVVISVSLVVIFSEILPQAICTRAPLAVGAFFSPLCWLLMLILFPISWPISKALDWLIPGEGAHFLASRSQVTSLLEIIHRNHVLSDDEAAIIQSVISIKQKTIDEVMIPVDDVYMLEMAEKLTRDKLTEILRIGHSRIPVYRGHNRANIQGVLLTKRLIVARPEDGDSVSKYLQSTSTLLASSNNGDHRSREHVLKPIWVKPDTDVFTLLDEFQRARCHLAIVADDLSEVALAYHADKDIERMTEIRGIVTMEDLVEIVLAIDINEQEDAAIAVESDDELPTKTRILDPKSAKPSTLNEVLSNLTILAEQKALTRRSSSKPIVPLKKSKTTVQQSTKQSNQQSNKQANRSINQSKVSMLKQPLLLGEEKENSTSSQSRSRSNSHSFNHSFTDSPSQTINRSINREISGSLRIDCDDSSLPNNQSLSRNSSDAGILTPVGSMRRGNRRFLLSNPPINIGSNQSINRSINQFNSQSPPSAVNQSNNQSPSLNSINNPSPFMSWSDSPVLMEEHLPNGQIRVTIAPKHEAKARVDDLEARANHQSVSQSSDSSDEENDDMDIVSAFAAKVLDSIAAKRKNSLSSSDEEENARSKKSRSSPSNNPSKSSPSHNHSINESNNQSNKQSNNQSDKKSKSSPVTSPNPTTNSSSSNNQTNNQTNNQSNNQSSKRTSKQSSKSPHDHHHHHGEETGMPTPHRLTGLPSPSLTS